MANTATSRRGEFPRLRQARRGLRRDRHALRGPRRRSSPTSSGPIRDAGPRVRRRASDARGEHLPDDPRRAGCPGDGGVRGLRYSSAVERPRRRSSRFRWGRLDARREVTIMGEAWHQRSRSASRSSKRRPALRTGRKARAVDPSSKTSRGRADTDRRACFARPWLQHRHADGRADRRRSGSPRVTLTVDGALHPIDQVTKQLHKLINVFEDPRTSSRRTPWRAELALFQGVRGRRPARRADADRRDLPRQGRRRDESER